MAESTVPRRRGKPTELTSQHPVVGKRECLGSLSRTQLRNSISMSLSSGPPALARANPRLLAVILGLASACAACSTIPPEYDDLPTYHMRSG